MKVKQLVERLSKLDQECDIYYCGEEDETCHQISIEETQERLSNKTMLKYYTIEKE